MIMDSGERREFSTGAVRDMGENGQKGRCDLLPLDTIDALVHEGVLTEIDRFIRTQDPNAVKVAIARFADSYYSGKDTISKVYTAMLEVAKHFEEGATKYGERNWEKGIPLHCYVDSAVRHYLKFMRGDEDERHDRAFLWNLLCALWTLEHHPELNDLPKEPASYEV